MVNQTFNRIKTEVSLKVNVRFKDYFIYVLLNVDLPLFT